MFLPIYFITLMYNPIVMWCSDLCFNNDYVIFNNQYHTIRHNKAYEVEDSVMILLFRVVITR